MQSCFTCTECDTALVDEDEQYVAYIVDGQALCKQHAATVTQQKQEAAAAAAAAAAVAAAAAAAAAEAAARLAACKVPPVVSAKGFTPKKTMAPRRVTNSSANSPATFQ